MKKKNRFLLILLTLSLTLSILLMGCGGSKSSTQSVSNTVMKNSTSDKMDLSVGANSSSANSKNSANSSDNTTIKNNSKIIKTATIELETKNYENTLSSITKTVEAKGGYIQNSKSYNNDDNNSRVASFTIKIPKDYFDDFLLNVGNLGKITSSSVTGENISTQYYDTEAHITALKVQEQRLLELLKQSGSLNDMLQIEKQLTDVRYQIESLTAQIKNWDNQVDYSTVNINITEVKELSTKPTSYGGKVSNTFSTSLKSLGAFFKILFLILVAIFPYLVIIVPIFIIVHFVRKKRKTKF